MSDKKSSNTKNYPLLPLRDVIIFPHMVVPLFVGREKSISALEKAAKNGNELFLVTQKDASVLNPEREDVYDIGTVVNIIQMLRLPDNTVKVLIEGKHRAKISNFDCKPEGYFADVEECEDVLANQVSLEATVRSVKNIFEQYVKLNKKIPPEVIVSVNQIEEPSKMADSVASHLAIKLDEKQDLLALPNTSDRLEKIFGYMEGEIGVLQVEKRIRTRVKQQMEKTQREYYLNEQMKAIQKELGEGEDGVDEIGEIEQKIEKLRITKEAKDKCAAEIKKLRQMSPMSAEATVVRNYLDWMISVPWKKKTRVKKDIKAAQKILDKDHYGLEKVKERILEYLAVQQRTNKVKGQIICLMGPPGVGKTSLGKSIAKATNREFIPRFR